MFRAARIAALRRMKLDDMIAKLEQIEQQAALTLSEYPHGHTVERQRLVMAIARQMRSHLEDQARYGERERLSPAGEAQHLHAVEKTAGAR
ncbi:MAG TPA: hypothetical protein VFB08_17380 [Burkholderiales bacterium]|nr:hypothetical protein [Burkholderiales bacterium]